MNKIIGYARVSTTDQKRAAQIDFLKLLGCQKNPSRKDIYHRKGSILATKSDRGTQEWRCYCKHQMEIEFSLVKVATVL